MSRELVTNELQNKVLNGINNKAEEAYQKMQQKKEQYNFAMKTFSIFKQKREIAFAKFRSQKGTGQENEAKNRYQSVDKQTFLAEINADVLRDSFNRDIFFCAKMNNSAFIANSILG